MTRNENINLKWEVLKRQEEIERCIYWQGYVNRRNLIDSFGISPQQASADLSLYKKSAPNNLVFNNSLKRYEPSLSFETKYIATDLDDYLSWNKSFNDSAYASVPSPLRAANPLVLKSIVNAVHLGKSVQVSYQSMSSSSPSTRRITPHNFVFDGFRHHVRAYCHLRNDYRDFVLGRIISAANLGIAGKTRKYDDKWNTLVPLQLTPHPDLTPEQKDIIMYDFKMTNGVAILRVREAMLIYTLTQLRLDRFSCERTPAEQQIVLLNTDVHNLVLS